jgi:pre-mRNA-processing factor 6
MATRRDFLNQQAPENYVAGLGRGATGFTTRSDLGPAREGPSDDQIKAAVARRSAQLGLTAAKDDGGDDDENRYQDPENEVGLFSGGIYEKDDEEADTIWREVDDKMAKRRQRQRLVTDFHPLNWLIPRVPLCISKWFISQRR